MIGGKEEINMYEGNNGNPPVSASHDKAKNTFGASVGHLSTKNKAGASNVCPSNTGCHSNIAAEKLPPSSPNKNSIGLIGGASSAWRASAYSRGPVNYPNNGWYDGKQQFNQFTKTGEYIKNTDLPYAAAPISTGAIKDPDCMKGTISKWGDQFAKFGGAKKKKSPPKKKKSVPKKKKSPPKKKKSVPKKKKYSVKKIPQKKIKKSFLGIEFFIKPPNKIKIIKK